MHVAFRGRGLLYFHYDTGVSSSSSRFLLVISMMHSVHVFLVASFLNILYFSLPSCFCSSSLNYKFSPILSIYNKDIEGSAGFSWASPLCIVPSTSSVSSVVVVATVWYYTSWNDTVASIYPNCNFFSLEHHRHQLLSYIFPPGNTFSSSFFPSFTCMLLRSLSEIF